ncbi:MAG: TIGR02147 family protein [Bdellovibrionales bacterium]
MMSSTQSLPTSRRVPSPPWEFAQILMEEYEKCKSTNPRYSIRAFARKIDIHPATLSSIFKGKRKLPKKRALPILERLKLPDGRRNRFLRSLKIEDDPRLESLKPFRAPERELSPQLHSKMIIDWEYYAVLHLLEIPQVWNADLVARRLNLPILRAQEILKGLEAAELVQRTQDTYQVKPHGGLTTSHDIPCEALRKAHENELALASQKLSQVPVSQRDFSSRTLAIDSRKLPEAKKLIQRFSQEMGDLLTDGPKDQVYLLAVQLFPLTQVGNSP